MTKSSRKYRLKKFFCATATADEEDSKKTLSKYDAAWLVSSLAASDPASLLTVTCGVWRAGSYFVSTVAAGQ